MDTPANTQLTPPPPIYIVSGGAGASAEQLVHTVLVQFPENQIPVITVAHVRQVEQLQHVVLQAVDRVIGGADHPHVHPLQNAPGAEGFGL